jgi:nitrate reductase gamma subunit
MAMAPLDFARGPAMRWAMEIMVAGLCWRLADFAIRRPARGLYWARKAFHAPGERWQLDSFAMHGGLIVVLFGFAPHILFIHEFTRLSWPSLPTPIVLFAAAIAIAAMIAVLVHRIVDTRPSAFSPFDDYFTWGLVFLAMVTGMLAYPHVGGTPLAPPYAALLTAHLLAVELLMVWLPFGKLVHVAFMPVFRVMARIRGVFRPSPTERLI